jgi:hypothetical protein
MRRIGMLFALALAACGGDATTAEGNPSPTASSNPSPAAVVDDFHAEWCAAVLPYSRLIEGEIVVPGSDPSILRGLDDTVERLDSLSVALSDADLDDAAATVRILADRIAEQGDVASQPVIPTTKEVLDALHDGRVATKAVGRAIGPAVDIMGRC